MAVAVAEKLITQETADGLVIVDPMKGTVQVLESGVASDIWVLLNEGKSVEEINAYIVSEYPSESGEAVDEVEVAADTDSFLNTLKEIGLLI